jgi:hypothetical protein
MKNSTIFFPQDLPLRKIEVIVAPNSFRLIQIPIIPLQTGFVSVRARVDNTGDRLLARTQVLPEGVTVESSTVLTVDLNGRSSFVGNVGGNPNLRGVRSETTLTVSAGVVGPLLPFNVTPAIGQPQVRFWAGRSKNMEHSLNKVINCFLKIICLENIN